jgi:hypothetical protein
LEANPETILETSHEDFPHLPRRGLVDRISTSSIQLKPTAVSTAASMATNTTGKITVTINIDLVSKFASGVTYHCSVAAIGGELDTTRNTVAGGMETASTVATTGKNGTSCTLHIPYSWTLPSDSKAETGLILAFGVGAVSGAGTSATTVRSTLQVDGIENLPASGATSTYTFDVTL